MGNKAKVIFLIFTMLMTLLLTIYISFAWFSMIEYTKPIVITTGSLKAEAKLYRGIDSDLDGILDNDEYEEITEGGITFANIIPGQIYTFKLYVQNKGTIDGELTVSVNQILFTDPIILNSFTLNFIEPIENQTVSKTFDETQDGVLVMFADYLIESKTYIELDFTIEINPSAGAAIRGETMTISNYLIFLIQEKTEIPSI